jgi:dihydroorotase
VSQKNIFKIMQTNILFKNVVIIDKNSPFHLQKVDIYINQNHIIEKIDKKIENISTSEATIIECEENFASIGWVDMHSHISEIGLEHKETLYSGSRAAAKGGFTTVCTLPNTKPVIQTKNEISFIKNNPHQIIEILPIAAVTIDTLGKDLTEMIDLHHAGAVAFSDGENSLENSDMVRKILLYLQKFDGLLIQKAQDNYLAKFGQIHEGKIATLLGLKGLPSLAEEIIIQRDLKLLAYTGGKIHFTLISTADSVQQIREAKQKGLQVTCSVAAHQLAFTEEMLISLDTNLKVNPPFRTENDRKALITGLQDGTIDAIVSAHLPQDIENKL